MEQFSQAEQNNELLQQTVTDAELREILERIGHEEFNGNPLTTIQDIAEGTSADPAAIGRILGEIRKEDWEQRFGLELKDHAKRIITLEAKQNPPPVVPRQVLSQPMTPPVVQSPTSYTGTSQRQYGYGSRQKSTNPALGVVVAVSVALIIGILLVPMCTLTAGPVQIHPSFPSPQVDGRVILDPNSSLTPEQRRALEDAVNRANSKPRATIKSPNGDPFPFPVNEADLDGLRKK